MRNDIYCVVPNWNGQELLSSCLDSLMAQTLKSQIIVVDNGSTDGSQEFIKQSYPDVELIELDKNYGFAGGVNRGIEAAIKDDIQFVALFNNDAVAEKDWLERLLINMQQHKKAAIVTSKILRMDKKHLDSTGDFYSIWGLPFPRGRNEIDNGKYDDQTVIFSASGGASLYRSEALKQIGMFDEDFFAYFEDVDISFRAQLAGWTVQYEPSAVAYHYLSVTSAKLGNFSTYHSVKNFWLLYGKNMPTGLYWKYLPLRILQFGRWFITSTLRGKMLTFLQATFAVIRLSPQSSRKRKLIQASRKVPVGYIDSMLYHHRPPKPPTFVS